MRRAILAALLGHWRRNPLQLLTLLAGLALGTALWSGVQAINAEARASYDAAASTLSGSEFGHISAQDGGVISHETYVALRRAGWGITPVIEGTLGRVLVLGIDPLTTAGSVGVNSFGQGGNLAAFLSHGGQILARPQTLAQLPETGADLVPSADAPPDTAIMDIGLAQRLLGRDGQIDRLMLTPTQPITRRPLHEIVPGLTETPPHGQQDIARLTDSFHLNLSAFGLLSFAVALFIVQGAIGLAFEQRRPMLRTIRALGVPLRLLILMIAFELAALALVAGAIGVALGYGVAAALLPDVAATLRGLYGADISGQLSLRPVWWLSGLGVSIAGTGMVAAGALWALARMPLLASAQPRALALARQGKGWGVVAAGLLAGAGVLAAYGTGLWAGFAMLGALLVGGALALPPFLALVLRLAQSRSKGVVAQWFWADTRQQVPGLSLALMALLLAMAANVGVSTMVSSFRLTFIGFLDQRLASELYVSASDTRQAKAIQAVAKTRAQAILPILSIDRPINGLPAQIYGARDHATYRDNWQLLRAAPLAWDSMARGDGVLVNEQLFRRAGLDLGAMVGIAPGVTLPVVGIYSDYGNPIGQVIVTETLFARVFPQIEALRFGLRLDQDQTGQLRRDLHSLAGVPEAAMIDQAALKALSLAVFERTFTVTTALNILTLSVAGFAILMSLLTLAAMRLPQLAPVWALGLTRRHLAGLDLLRALVLAGLTAVLALPLGLALAWALLAVVNVQAFGWLLPMYLFPLDYLRLGGLALVAVALAALWPAWRLSRLAPAVLLGVFRNER